MRTLIVGAGSIGGFFGGKLLSAGRDITFLVRDRRAQQLSQFGLVIERPEGPLSLPSPPTVTKDRLDASFDCVIVACKAYDLAAATEDFAPAVGPQTMIVPLLNGMGHMDVLDARFGPDRVLGGLCVVSTTLRENGTIVQMGDLQSLTIGSREGNEFQRTREIDETFGNAGFDFTASTQILQEMWNKWVFISAAAAITSSMRSSIGDMVEAGGSEFAKALLHECVTIADANGFAPDAAIISRYAGMFTTPGSPLTASLFRDMEQHREIEAEAIVGELLKRRPGHIQTPLLDVAYLVMKSYQARRTREAKAN